MDEAALADSIVEGPPGDTCEVRQLKTHNSCGPRFKQLTFCTRLIKRDSASVERKENQLRTGNSSVGSESRPFKINLEFYPLI